MYPPPPPPPPHQPLDPPLLFFPPVIKNRPGQPLLLPPRPGLRQLRQARHGPADGAGPEGRGSLPVSLSSGVCAMRPRGRRRPCTSLISHVVARGPPTSSNLKPQTQPSVLPGQRGRLWQLPRHVRTWMERPGFAFRLVEEAGFHTFIHHIPTQHRGIAALEISVCHHVAIRWWNGMWGRKQRGQRQQGRPPTTTRLLAYAIVCTHYCAPKPNSIHTGVQPRVRGDPGRQDGLPVGTRAFRLCEMYGAVFGCVCKWSKADLTHPISFTLFVLTQDSRLRRPSERHDHQVHVLGPRRHQRKPEHAGQSRRH